MIDGERSTLDVVVGWRRGGFLDDLGPRFSCRADLEQKLFESYRRVTAVAATTALPSHVDREV